MSGALFAMSGSRAAGTIETSLPSGGNATSSSWDLLNTGAYSTGDLAGGSLTGPWVTPQSSANAAQYQVKIDVTGGAFSAGDATGSWLDLSTSRFWTKTTPGTVTFTVSIREKITGAVRTVQAGKTLTVS